MRSPILLFLAIAAFATPARGDWRPLAPGLALGNFTIQQKNHVVDPPIVVLRIDPNLWDLEVIGRGWPGETGQRTAKQWCEKHRFTAAINAGMYGTDYTTHLGFLRSGGHVNNHNINRYQSVAAFDPKPGRDLPRFRIYDLDAPGVSMKMILRDYAAVIQNLRLIKRSGKNRWGRSSRNWSEAALGEDDCGRALFIFSPSPFSMHDLINELLSMDIGIVAAQHLDGGPVAQFYLRIGDVEIHMAGSSDASFGSSVPMSPVPIPNVIGVRPIGNNRK